jgi:hypothetical protein
LPRDSKDFYVCSSHAREVRLGEQAAQQQEVHQVADSGITIEDIESRAFYRGERNTRYLLFQAREACLDRGAAGQIL